MGSSFVYVKENGYDLHGAFDYLKKFEVVEASDEAYFNKQFSIQDIEEIELGTDGTNESVIRFKDGSFAVIDKTFDVKKLRKVKK